MPWKIVHEKGDGYWVVKESTGKKEHKKAHPTHASALAHLRALYASENPKKESR